MKGIREAKEELCARQVPDDCIWADGYEKDTCEDDASVSPFG